MHPYQNQSPKRLYAAFAKLEKGSGGNHQQKRYPVNPISYLQRHHISEIFRFILTHPDMDHMDGIMAMFQTFPPTNFWDTDNRKELAAISWEGSPYNAEDWRFYKYIRDNRRTSNPKRLALLSGDTAGRSTTKAIPPPNRSIQSNGTRRSRVGTPARQAYPKNTETGFGS